MPSPIAHSVTGYCLAKVCPQKKGQGSSRHLNRIRLGVAIFAAVAADLDFLPQLFVDADFHRGITHSVGFAIAVSLLLAAVVNRHVRQAFAALFSLALLASLSHLFLDLITTGGRGIPLLWPLSQYLVQSPMTIFPQVHHSEGLIYRGHIPVLIFEGAYALILLWLTNTYQNQRERFQPHSPSPLSEDHSQSADMF